MIWITYIIIFLSFFILSIFSTNLEKQNQFFNNYFTKTILYISFGLMVLWYLYVVLYTRDDTFKSLVFIAYIPIFIAFSYIFYFINSSDDDDNDNKNNTKQIIFSVSLWCVTGIMFLCMVGLGYAYLETARLIEIFSGPFVKKIPHKTGYKN
jgi:hypothetical protein